MGVLPRAASDRIPAIHGRIGSSSKAAIRAVHAAPGGVSQNPIPQGVREGTCQGPRCPIDNLRCLGVAAAPAFGWDTYVAASAFITILEIATLLIATMGPIPSSACSSFQPNRRVAQLDRSRAPASAVRICPFPNYRRFPCPFQTSPSLSTSCMDQPLEIVSCWRLTNQHIDSDGIASRSHGEVRWQREPARLIIEMIGGIRRGCALISRSVGGCRLNDVGFAPRKFGTSPPKFSIGDGGTISA